MTAPPGGDCFHCGDALPPNPPQVTLEGVERAVCCEGCGAAAAWIRDAGLGDYYRLREAEGLRVDENAGDFRIWDRDDVLSGHAVTTATGREITLVVEGMHCAACSWLICRALARVDGVDQVDANAITGRVRISWDPARTALSRVLARLSSLGYRPHLAQGEAAERERRGERNRMIARLGVAALGGLQAMMFAEALYLDTAREMPRPPATSSAGSPSWCPRRWCSIPAGPSFPAWRGNCACAGRAWTRWSPAPCCWPISPAWRRRCAVARTSGSMRR
jgi:Cu2+-exporting ATPase